MNSEAPQSGSSTTRKGLPPLAWLGIGCGGLLVVGVVIVAALGWFAAKKVGDLAEDFGENPARAAAQMAVKLNPDLELVGTDDDADTVTLRNTRTGEVATLNFEDLKKGRFIVETGKGKTTISGQPSGQAGGATITTDKQETTIGGRAAPGDMPDWIPPYPGAGEITSGFASSGDQGSAGSFHFKTDDELKTVLDFYQKAFKDEGCQVQRHTFAQGGMITSNHKMKRQNATVMITQQDGQRNVTVTYNEKRQPR